MDHLENKRLTTEQVIERHGLWLRGRTGGLRADFRGGELAEVYLKGVNLRKADLNGADMTGANFERITNPPPMLWKK